MTHFAVLRHGFDIHRNPDRLGPACDEKFCLALNNSGNAPSSLEGNTVWLISWEGFMKTHHVVCGWFQMSHIGRRHGVVAQYYASGDEGVMFARGLGPLDMREWFHKFVEANRRFRDGEPTEVDEYVGELLSLSQAAGYRVPTLSSEKSVAENPAPH